MRAGRNPKTYLPPLAILLTVLACRPGRSQEVTPPSHLYPWQPQAHDRLDARFPAPSGFTRIPLAEGSFGAFLRSLPLTPAGTPVVDCCGHLVRAGDDPRIQAVVDIDVGPSDLQQCADAVLRMNAEWRYGRGERAIAYPVASGAVLSYEGYLAGDRARASGNQLLVQRTGRRTADDHVAFRTFLDEVFAWANTSSLAREGTPVDMAEVRPGDFFVTTGRPFGHAVLVLDVARSPSGPIALLLGQSYMPAQSFQVLGDPGRPAATAAWFLVTPGDTEVDTPFWKPFPLSSLRRFPAARTST